MDEGRDRTAGFQRAGGQGHQGRTLHGSLTLSVDMSKAFDEVNRVRLREALEHLNANSRPLKWQASCM